MKNLQLYIKKVNGRYGTSNTFLLCSKRFAAQLFTKLHHTFCWNKARSVEGGRGHMKWTVSTLMTVNTCPHEHECLLKLYKYGCALALICTITLLYIKGFGSFYLRKRFTMSRLKMCEMPSSLSADLLNILPKAADDVKRL